VKIVVVGGAGAMGGVWASSLSRAGHDVTILDVAKEAIAVINRDGVTVEESDGSTMVTPVPATDRADEIGSCDVAIIFTKAHHTRSAAELVKLAINSTTTVVSLQNGWGSAGVLAEVFEPEQIAIGVTYHGATVVSPGRLIHTLNTGPTFLGPYVDGAPLDRATGIGDAMTTAGFPTTVTADVMTEVWKKLIVNSSGLPVASLTGLTTGGMGASEDLMRVCDALVAEGVEVARAKGYSIDVADWIAAVRGVLARGGKGKASMLQDVEARRKTEIEVINGAIVREADELGIDVPLNRAMLALIQGIEASWRQ
jgi:2-dehydropantoate 2-reductase